MNPLVSTIIPAYNAEAWVGVAIESALAQNVDQEILVIDDGSTDSTADVVAQYPPPVRLISKQNGGVSSARNLGLDQARGEYVAFLDADDRWYPEKLRTQLSVLDKFPAAGTVICDERHVDAEGTTVRPSFFATRIFTSELPTQDALASKPFTWLTRESFFPTSGVLTRKSVAEKAGRFDEQLNLVEDRDYWIRLAQIAPIAVTPKVLLDYRFENKNSLSRVKEVVWARCLMIVLTRNEAELKKRILGEEGDPDAIFASIHLNLARIFWNSGDYALARKAYRGARVRSPKDFMKYLVCVAATWGQRLSLK